MQSHLSSKIVRTTGIATRSRSAVQAKAGLLDRLFGSKTMDLPQKWWTKDTVAVVTGANKGIGFEIARILAQQGLHTIVTARDETLGKAATEKIQKAAGPEGGKVDFHQLDISKPASVAAFKDWLKNNYGSLTILVNNAGFAYKGDVFGPDEARATFAINYYGTVSVTEALLPLMADNTGRVVTVSSRAGLSSIIKDPKLRDRFANAKSKAEVDGLVDEFLAAVDTRSDEELRARGWPKSMYGMSKLAVSTWTRVLAQELKPRGIAVNACCPGWVATDMSSNRGTKTPAEGADTPVWLALQPPAERPEELVTGGLWGERREYQF